MGYCQLHAMNSGSDAQPLRTSSFKQTAAALLAKAADVQLKPGLGRVVSVVRKVKIVEQERTAELGKEEEAKRTALEEAAKKKRLEEQRKQLIEFKKQQEEAKKMKDDEKRRQELLQKQIEAVRVSVEHEL